MMEPFPAPFPTNPPVPGPALPPEPPVPTPPMPFPPSPAPSASMSSPSIPQVGASSPFPLSTPRPVSPPVPPPPSLPPVSSGGEGGNMIERARGLFRPLLIVAIVILVGVAAVSFLLSGNLSSLPLIGGLFGKSGNITLTYWGLWEDSDVINPLLAEFVTSYENANPGVTLTINYEKRTFSTLDQYKETLLTRLQQGTGPDVFRLHNSWVSAFAAELSPLPSSVLSEENYALRFYPSALSSAKVGTDILALPLEYDGLVLFYNKKLITATVASKIKTWEDFRREAVKLTTWVGNDRQKGKILRSGAAIGVANNISHSSDLLSLLLAQSGVSPLTGLNTVAAADALTFYTNFAKVDRVWNETLPFSINAFANGQVAMIIAPSWRALDIAALAPKLSFATAPIPQTPSAQVGGVNWASFWMEGVSKDSANATVAWKLLEFLSQEDQQRAFYAAAAKNRLFGEPYAVRSLAASLSEQPILGPLLSSAPTAVSSKTTDLSGDSAYVTALKQAISDVLGGTKATDALKTAQTTINQLEGVVTTGTGQ